MSTKREIDGASEKRKESQPSYSTGKKQRTYTPQ